MNYPKKTRAIILPAYNKNLMRALLSLKIEEIDLPAPRDSEVVIKVLSSPINPSDLAFLQGTYNIVKPLPAIPGFEATGEVVAAGDEYQDLVGKNVSVFLQDESIGCWSEYLLVSGANCIVVNPKIDVLQAATIAINPLTALGMFEFAKKRNSSTLILNAAGGQVPEIIRAFARAKEVEIINIFRKRGTADGLSSVKNQINLCTEDEDFEDNLKAACAGKTNITALDAVGGLQSGLLFNALPKDSIQVIYGGLSNEAIGGIDTLSMIFNNKSIIGFNLNHFIADCKKEGRFEEVTNTIQENIISEKIETKINQVFPLEEVVKGIRTYIKNMSAGKVILGSV